MILKRFKTFESLTIPVMEFDPVFLEDWKYLLTMYNGYSDRMDEFYKMLEDDLDILFSSGYSNQTVLNNEITAEESKLFKQLRKRVTDKLDSFAKEFGKAYMIEDKYKMGPSRCFLIDGKSYDGKMPQDVLEAVLKSPEYREMLKYFNKIWYLWEYFDRTYTNFFHSAKIMIGKNSINMLTEFQDLLETYKGKMVDREKLPELPSLS